MTTYRFPHRDPDLIGKYAVKELKINTLPALVQSDADSIPTTIYMDSGRDFVVDYNSLKRRHIGTYTYDKNTGSIGVMWRYPDKTETPLKGTLVRVSGNILKLNAVLGKDTINCIIEKIN